MKKLISALITVFLIICSAVPCLAAEYMSGEQAEINVFATYRYSSDPNIYAAEPANGIFTITTNEGFTVTVKPEHPLSDGVRLVTHFISDNENDAYKWFSDCTKEIGKNILPLDIYFIDADGKKISVTENMTIEITLPDGYVTPIVCYLSTDGKVTVLDSKTKNGKTSFTTNHMSYYVIGEKIVDKPITDDSPQTGDNSSILLWMALLLVSGGVVGTLGLTRKKRKHADEK